MKHSIACLYFCCNNTFALSTVSKYTPKQSFVFEVFYVDFYWISLQISTVQFATDVLNFFGYSSIRVEFYGQSQDSYLVGLMTVYYSIAFSLSGLWCQIDRTHLLLFHAESFEVILGFKTAIWISYILNGDVVITLSMSMFVYWL